jgi:transketolase
MIPPKETMRDAFIEEVFLRMHDDRRIFFLTADFGAPKLDRLRTEMRDRFINVGIAEQNLVNIAAGLALEGFTVFAYAIAPFLVMRAYEQIRNNLSLLACTHSVNVNLIGVGAGVSYDVSGPTHHTFEDIGIIRALPNVTLFSPSDGALARKFVDYSIKAKGPKYLRFDGKPLPLIYQDYVGIDIEKGYCQLEKGEEVCLVSTGYMTHTALKAVREMKKEGISPGLIDLFLLKPLNEESFFNDIRLYKHIVTIEEAYCNKGGLDCLVSSIIDNHRAETTLIRMGFKDAFVFNVGSRDYLHAVSNLSADDVISSVKKAVSE